MRFSPPHAIVAAGCLLLTLATGADAMRVAPMILELTASGSSATGRIEVRNLFPNALAYETRVWRVNFTPEGEPVETAADQDFLIFPPQGILAPGGRQVIRVQWAGSPDVASSQAYYISIRQVAVPLAQQNQTGTAAQVQILYNMKALVTVEPKDAKPLAVATKATPIDYVAKAGEGEATPAPGPGVEVTIENSGRRHVMMSTVNWIIEGRGTNGAALTQTVPASEVERAIGSGYVAALDGKRIFKVPVKERFGPGPITLKFKR